MTDFSWGRPCILMGWTIDPPPPPPPPPSLLGPRESNCQRRKRGAAVGGHRHRLAGAPLGSSRPCTYISARVKKNKQQPRLLLRRPALIWEAEPPMSRCRSETFSISLERRSLGVVTRFVLGEAILLTVALLWERARLALCLSVCQESALRHCRGSCFAHQPHSLMCRGVIATASGGGERGERSPSKASAGRTVVLSASRLVLIEPF